MAVQSRARLLACNWLPRITFNLLSAAAGKWEEFAIGDVGKELR